MKRWTIGYVAINYVANTYLAGRAYAWAHHWREQYWPVDVLEITKRAFTRNIEANLDRKSQRRKQALECALHGVLMAWRHCHQYAKPDLAPQKMGAVRQWMIWFFKNY